MPFTGFLIALTLHITPVTDTGGLSLNDCFLKAVDRSYSLVNQGEVLKQAEEKYTQSWQNFMPVLSASGNEVISGYSDPTLGQTNIASMKLSVTQPLFRGFKNLAILEQSKSLIESQKEARKWALNQLYLDTAQSYYSLLSVHKQIEHLRNQIKLYDARIQEVTGWVRIGRSRSSDLLTIKAARMLAYSQMVQTKGQLSNHLELFRFLTGIENADIRDSSDFPAEAPALEPFLASTAERPDLKAAKAQNISIRKAIDIARSDRLPWADLAVSAGNAQLWKTTPFSWNIQLTLTYSLFADVFVQSKIREAESQSIQSDNAYQFLSDTIQKDVRVSYAALLSYLEQIKTYREAVQYLEDNYRQMEKDYRLSVVKITDVITANSSYEDAVRVLNTLLYSAQMEWLRIRVYSGQFRLPPEVTK